MRSMVRAFDVIAACLMGLILTVAFPAFAQLASARALDAAEMAAVGQYGDKAAPLTVFERDGVLRVDGRGFSLQGHEQGFFMGPTLLDHVKPHHRSYQEEIFGPVLPILKVLSSVNLSQRIVLN